MAIETYKICPSCGHHNAPNLIECEKCETDLQRVKIVYNDLEKTNNVNEIKEEPKTSFIKICPFCQTKNQPMAKECSKCHNDLALVLATKENAPVTKKIYKLVSDDGECEIIINNSFETIGRAFSKFSYLQTKECVSRRHLMVLILNNKMYIKNCQAVNANRPVITFLNEKMLKPNEKVEVINGDLIGLGGENFNKYPKAAYFKVVISDVCS